MANAIVNERFEKLVAAKDAPIQSAGTAYSVEFNLAEGPRVVGRVPAGAMEGRAGSS